jgi:RimJ/RimL family protein N-acetyltransferase
VTQQTLHTERLTLSPLSDDHLEHEVALDADPEVLRYLSLKPRTREEVERAHAFRLEQGREVDGLGVWAGFLRAEDHDEPIEGSDQGEVEYDLTRAAWDMMSR